MTDRRRSTRLRSFLGGSVSYANGRSKHECLVRNLSSRGAKLVFGYAVTLPSEFDLVIHKQRRSFRAKVKWCRALEVGVRLAPIPFEVAQPKRLREVRALKTRNRLLRGQAHRRVFAAEQAREA
jgi:hypothetical protein